MGILTSRVAAEASGLLAWKPPVDVVAVANVASLSGLQNIDGVTGAEGLAVLLTAQTTGAQNGPYLMSTGGWTRRYDMDTSADCVVGSSWRVTQGTLAGNRYYLSGPVGTTITLNTTALTFSEEPISSSGGALSVTSIAVSSFASFGATPAATGRIRLTAGDIIEGAGSFSLSSLGDTILIEVGPTGGTKTGLIVRRNDDLSSGQEAWLVGGVYKRRAFFPPDVTTTDATVTTLWSFTLADNTTYTIVARVTADQTSGTNSAGYERIVTVKRAGGAATIVGTVSTPHTAEDVAGWDCTFDVTSNDVRLRVTGAAATTVVWQADVTVNNK
jgi:hypothetical protein